MHASSRLALSLLAGLLVLGLAVPATVDAQSLDQARQQRAEVQERLDEAAQRMGELESRIGSLSDETATLQDEVAELQTRADEAQTQVADRIREMYKRGIDTPILQLLGSDDTTAALERAELAGQLLAGDRVEIEEASAARARADAAAERLAERRERLDAARQELESMLEGLREDLQAARQLEERLEEEKRQREAAARRRARQQAAAAEAAARAEAEATQQASTSSGGSTAPSSGGTACPVGAPRSYSDTWGAPRSGGRSHKGTDILADYGTPVYAIVSGTWDIYSYGSSAGNWAILRGNNGHDYYYMHLQRHVVGDGARVSAGRQVATNGDTGNATGTPHVHFEYHPGGGGAVNPYPLVRSACG